MHIPPNLDISGILGAGPGLDANKLSIKGTQVRESMSSSQEVITKKGSLDNCFLLNMNTGDLGRWLSGYRTCCASTGPEFRCPV